MKINKFVLSSSPRFQKFHDKMISFLISNSKKLQLTEDRRKQTSGPNVQNFVEQEHKTELGLVQTLLLNTAEMIVMGRRSRRGTVIPNLVQVRFYLAA